MIKLDLQRAAMMAQRFCLLALILVALLDASSAFADPAVTSGAITACPSTRNLTALGSGIPIVDAQYTAPAQKQKSLTSHYKCQVLPKGTHLNIIARDKFFVTIKASSPKYGTRTLYLKATDLAP